MPATTDKQRLLTSLFTALRKAYDAPAAEERRVLEQLLYALLRENAPAGAADRAYRNLTERFFDWNEVRVSSVHEVEAALEDVPQARAKAQRLIDLLQEVFESTYSFDLELINKKGLKQAARQMARYQSSSEFAAAWVVQRSLAGHAVPVDAPALRTLKRLGMVDESVADLAAVQASMEHHIPKNKAVQFVDLLNALAHDRCGDEPRCGGCPLKSECVYGTARPATVRAARPKPR